MAVAATRQFNRLVDDASDPRVLIQDAIHAQVAATPDRVAAEFLGDGRSLTYAALAGEAAALAARLLALGAGGRDALVALQVVKSLEMAAAILGVLDAGAAYLPLDPTWPASRRLFVCDDAACGALVVNGDAADDDEAAAAFESRGRLRSRRACRRTVSGATRSATPTPTTRSGPSSTSTSSASAPLGT